MSLVSIDALTELAPPLPESPLMTELPVVTAGLGLLGGAGLGLLRGVGLGLMGLPGIPVFGSSLPLDGAGVASSSSHSH